ncbi:Zn-ribbon domain-containing OB-fold protein [Cupriavidus sp. TA19]|uniref:Zn-ribbon domain-containing OB-fold protein n=1 Tax=Cupriavidus sp. TA19 TaxID=701108 RepID=UPI00398BD45F
MTLKSFQEDPYVAANPESLPFWRAAEEGVLLGKACSDCGKLHWYPRAICPFCGSDHTEWKPLSGRGTVYASRSTITTCGSACRSEWPSGAPMKAVTPQPLLRRRHDESTVPEYFCAHHGRCIGPRPGYGLRIGQGRRECRYP